MENKIELVLFKPSGKYYMEHEVTLPDEEDLEAAWLEDVRRAGEIMYNRRVWLNGYVEENLEDYWHVACMDDKLGYPYLRPSKERFRTKAENEEDREELAAIQRRLEEHARLQQEDLGSLHYDEYLAEAYALGRGIDKNNP